MARKMGGYVCDNDECRKFVGVYDDAFTAWITSARSAFRINDPHPIHIGGRNYYCSEACWQKAEPQKEKAE